MIYILFTVLFLIALIFFCRYLFCQKLTGEINDKWKIIGSVASAIVSAYVFLILSFQLSNLSESINIQSQTFEIQNRPYLYAILNPLSREEMIKITKSEDPLSLPSSSERLFMSPAKEDVWHGGGYLFLRNKGKVPATIISEKTKTDYKVNSDVKPDTGLLDEFNEKRGGFPHIKVVSPDQENSHVWLFPWLGKMPRLIEVWASITYTGIDKKKEYWYIYKRLYGIKYYKDEKDGKIYPLIVTLVLEEDWDMNDPNRKRKQYEVTDWQKYYSAVDMIGK